MQHKISNIAFNLASMALQNAISYGLQIEKHQQDPDGNPETMAEAFTKVLNYLENRIQLGKTEFFLYFNDDNHDFSPESFDNYEDMIQDYNPEPCEEFPLRDPATFKINYCQRYTLYLIYA